MDWKKTIMHNLHMYDLKLSDNATVSVHCAYDDKNRLLSILGIIRFGTRRDKIAEIQVLNKDATGMDPAEAIGKAMNEVVPAAVEWLADLEKAANNAIAALRTSPPTKPLP